MRPPPTSADVTDDNAASIIAATPALATISGNAVKSSHNSVNTGGNTTASSADKPAEASTTASSGTNNYKISGWFVPQVKKRERRGAAFRTLLLALFLGMFTTVASAAMPPVPTNTAMHDSAFNAKSWARWLRTKESSPMPQPPPSCACAARIQAAQHSGRLWMLDTYVWRQVAVPCSISVMPHACDCRQEASFCAS